MFQKGVSGNPSGKTKGTRHRLSRQFIDDMQAAWAEKGKQVILEVINKRPQDFLKIVAMMMPKEFHIKTETIQELTDDELISALDRLRSSNMAKVIEHVGERTEETQRYEQTQVL